MAFAANLLFPSSLRTTPVFLISNTHVASHRCYCRCSSSIEKRMATLTEIQNSGVIACLRATRGKLAMEAASAAIDGGIRVLEIVSSTPGVFEVIKGLVRDHPEATIGVGTVLSVKDAKSAVEAGAKFLMSPAIVNDILLDVKDSDVLYIPGVMTPTEVLNAYISGASIVKLYPISALGGVQYISALRKPFPHIPMVASQGIKLESIEEYITEGASAVVLSDAIFGKEAMIREDFNAIHRLASKASSHGSNAVKQKRTHG